MAANSIIKKSSTKKKHRMAGTQQVMTVAEPRYMIRPTGPIMPSEVMGGTKPRRKHRTGGVRGKANHLVDAAMRILAAAAGQKVGDMLIKNNINPLLVAAGGGVGSVIFNKNKFVSNGLESAAAAGFVHLFHNKQTVHGVMNGVNDFIGSALSSADDGAVHHVVTMGDYDNQANSSMSIEDQVRAAMGAEYGYSY